MNAEADARMKAPASPGEFVLATEDLLERAAHEDRDGAAEGPAEPARETVREPVTAHHEGAQLRYLRWTLSQLPARALAETLRAEAERRAHDDPVATELRGATSQTIQRWEAGVTPIPPGVLSVIVRILGFPKRFLSEGYFRYRDRADKGPAEPARETAREPALPVT